MPPESWPAVREIYRQGIATGAATFETELSDWEKWDNGHRKDCRLLALEPVVGDAGDLRIRFDAHSDEASVLGWAAPSPVLSRLVYSGRAEVSLYLAAAARGRGAGKALLQELAKRSELHGNLDAAGRHFPGDRCQPRAAQGVRLQGNRREAACREAG